MALTVFTIDDSPTIRSILKTTLTDAGFEVFQADNGRDGLGMIDFYKPDVVITDLNMNIMGGYGVIKEIRQQPRYASLPILVLTTQTSEETKQKVRELGATGWITKPFDPEKLVRIIHRVTQTEAPAA